MPSIMILYLIKSFLWTSQANAYSLTVEADFRERRIKPGLIAGKRSAWPEGNFRAHSSVLETLSTDLLMPQRWLLTFCSYSDLFFLLLYAPGGCAARWLTPGSDEASEQCQRDLYSLQYL